MRRHPPPEVDPDRLRTLLASARARPDPPRRSGWIPEEEPPAADMSWLDESSVWDVGPSVVDGGGPPDRAGRGIGPTRAVTTKEATRQSTVDGW
jgi:hypothetical protein